MHHLIILILLLITTILLLITTILLIITTILLLITTILLIITTILLLITTILLIITKTEENQGLKIETFFKTGPDQVMKHKTPKRQLISFQLLHIY